MGLALMKQLKMLPRRTAMKQTQKLPETFTAMHKISEAICLSQPNN
jgi:hypothetical protein